MDSEMDADMERNMKIKEIIYHLETAGLILVVINIGKYFEEQAKNKIFSM
jgi:hypothetical protein